ncbi:MAG: hypothetical protein ABI725_10700 [Chloroflexota bacterium]
MLRHKAAISVIRSAVASIVAVAIGLAIGSAPVLAASADRGALVICNYKYLGDDSIYWGGILKRIDVSPPRLYALNSSTANVGWRFIVERQRFDQQVSPAPWKQTYKSTLQTAQASPTVAAPFATMTVKVRLPVLTDPQEYSWNEVYYRVTLKLFWYRADGTTQQAVTHKMKHYENWIDGEYVWSANGDYSCPGGHSNYQ